ncbi:hypothetical protein KOY_03255 [Bacillus cereus VDM021]|nr:hypothetical protein KOW_00584 [Bacillus cereus VDM006]EOQ09286.1 hypothetical protein KOY_03255 [Bacillus cereus VDM021]
MILIMTARLTEAILDEEKDILYSKILKLLK